LTAVKSAQGSEIQGALSFLGRSRKDPGQQIGFTVFRGSEGVEKYHMDTLIETLEQQFGITCMGDSFREREDLIMQIVQGWEPHLRQFSSVLRLMSENGSVVIFSGGSDSQVLLAQLGVKGEVLTKPETKSVCDYDEICDQLETMFASKDPNVYNAATSWIPPDENIVFSDLGEQQREQQLDLHTFFVLSGILNYYLSRRLRSIDK